MSRIAFLTRVLAFSHVVPPKAIERRPRAAGVLLNQIEPLDRDEQLVVAVVAQLEELLELRARARRRLPARRQLLQTDELADPVIDVDDEIANLQVAQVGEKRLRETAALVRGRTLFFEDVGLGVDLQCGVRETESSRERPDGDQHRCGMGASASSTGTATMLVFLEGSRWCALRGLRCRPRRARCRRARAPVGYRRSNRRRGRGTPSPADTTPDARRLRLRARALRGERAWSRALDVRTTAMNACVDGHRSHVASRRRVS